MSILYIVLNFLFAANMLARNESEHQIIVIDSLHKSGTHLAAKCVKLLTGKSSINAKNLDVWDAKELKNLPNNKFCISHATCTEENVKALREAKARGIYIYRDPRDHLVSLTHWVYKTEGWPELKKRKFDNVLLTFINHYITLNPKLSGKDSKSLEHIYERLYLPWKNYDFMYGVKFEDLVGPKGGGSKEAQLREIRNIAKHLNIPADEKKIQFVASNIFGGSSTFREGKQNSWKEDFKPMHRIAFKRKNPTILVKLGYEKDNNW